MLLNSTPVSDARALFALEKEWKSRAPPKVLAFVWRALLNRLPTRANLSRRQVIFDPAAIGCVLCGEPLESEVHLFLMC